ncbi:MAG: SGNH/GDSL hydrolase family protein [Pseudomonadota bacterium]
MIIRCIGDSHASFFSGLDKIQPVWPKQSQDILPFFRSYRLGPILAYNLGQKGTSSKGNEKLFFLLSTLSKKDFILLCFGEIDCRAHILRQTHRQNKNHEEIVEECVERYCGVIKTIQTMQYRLGVWNVPPSTPYNLENIPHYPTYGGPVERNDITRYFNKILAYRLKQEGIPFFSIFESLIKKDGTTDVKYLADEIHLNQNAMPFALHAINETLGTSFSLPKHKALLILKSYIKLLAKKIGNKSSVLQKHINL